MSPGLINPLTRMTDQELIERCRREERVAQQTLYERFAPVMFGICKRYLKTREDAEDVLIEGFFKVFSKLYMFKGEGSFEGWIKRIMVNECLMFLRKQHNFNLTVEFNGHEKPVEMNIDHEMDNQDVLGYLDKLPTGYRTIFNLYVLEGFKHREIADMLGISINTSKSQLILAKDKLRQLILQKRFPDAI